MKGPYDGRAPRIANVRAVEEPRIDTWCTDAYMRTLTAVDETAQETVVDLVAPRVVLSYDRAVSSKTPYKYLIN